MSALTDTGRSKVPEPAKLNVRYRPEADVGTTKKAPPERGLSTAGSALLVVAVIILVTMEPQWFP